MAFKISFSIGRSKRQSNVATKSGYTLQPFTENMESGMSYVVSGNSIKDILDTLRGEYTDRTLINLFSTVAEIFAPIDAIASRAAGARFGFRKKSTKAIVDNNPGLTRLIGDAVNPFQNFQQLFYEAIVYEYCTGKEFWYNNIPDTLAVDYKNIATQYNLPADRITIEVPERIKIFSAIKIEDVIQKYILDKGGNDETPFTTNTVLYRRRANLNWKARKIEGRSPLLSAEMAIANLIAVYQARNTIYVKRGAMGMWVSKKTDHSGNVSLTPTEKRDLRDELQKDYGIAGNVKKKHTIGYTDAPVDFIQSSMSIKDLEPFEETKADAAAIYGVLGVPYELAPKPQGETFSNQLTAEKSFYQNVIIPLVASYCKSLTNAWGIGKWDYELYATWGHIEVLQDNKKEEADRRSKVVEYATKQYKDGAITYNEWLKEMGYPIRGTEFDKYINDLESVPMAVKIGVGGTQAMQSVVADPNLSEDAKANLLVLLFGITIEQARLVVVTTPKPKTEE
jgi:hypothetical protein